MPVRGKSCITERELRNAPTRDSGQGVVIAYAIPSSSSEWQILIVRPIHTQLGAEKPVGIERHHVVSEVFRIPMKSP